MKIAIPCWNHHVSTVCDFSDRLLVVTIKSGRVVDRALIDFVEETIPGKTARLRDLGVQVLLCGAVSQSLLRMITISGIRVIPFLRGTVDDVLDAYFKGRLFDPRLVLPGCCACGRRRRGKGMRRRGGQGNRIL
jgi:predicted Fe-Mo cluster-binding NifX family protein